MSPRPDDPPFIAFRPASLRLVIALLAGLIVLTAAQIARPGALGQPAGFVDFHVFHLAGSLALEGHLSAAYHAADFAPLQMAQPGFSAFMPYTYPPQFALLASALAALPVWAAYLAFTGLGLTGFLWVARRLAGGQIAAPLLVVLPAAIVSARFGQNGMLSATLIGAACLWWSRPRGGLPLGLMACKPHLAVGLALAALLSRRWWLISTAAAVALVSGLAATLAFGPGIWSDVRAAARESAGFLDQGAYPLYRMTSTYALLRSLGFEASAAMAGHVAVAVGALGMVGHACRTGWRQDRRLALAVMACTLVSPYCYDYDMVIAGIAIAMAARDLARHATPRDRALLMAALWLAGGWGLARIALPGAAAGTPAFGALGAILAFALLFRGLARAEAGSAVPARRQPA